MLGDVKPAAIACACSAVIMAAAAYGGFGSAQGEGGGVGGKPIEINAGTLADNDALVYDQATDSWVNQPLGSVVVDIASITTLAGGELLCGTSSSVVNIGAGTAGYPLVSSGTGLAPTYTTPSAAALPGAAAQVGAVTSAAAGTLPVLGSSAATLIAPNATAGTPLVSAGAGVPPAYGDIAATALPAGVVEDLAAVTSRTTGAIPLLGSAAWTSVSPSATSGTPLVSQGAGASPAYGDIAASALPAGVVEDLAAVTSRTTGGLPILGSAAWTTLAPGTSAYALVSQGAGATPTWASVLWADGSVNMTGALRTDAVRGATSDLVLSSTSGTVAVIVSTTADVRMPRSLYVQGGGTIREDNGANYSYLQVEASTPSSQLCTSDGTASSTVSVGVTSVSLEASTGTGIYSQISMSTAGITTTVDDIDDATTLTQLPASIALSDGTASVTVGSANVTLSDGTGSIALNGSGAISLDDGESTIDMFADGTVAIETGGARLLVDATNVRVTGKLSGAVGGDLTVASAASTVALIVSSTDASVNVDKVLATHGRKVGVTDNTGTLTFSAIQHHVVTNIGDGDGSHIDLGTPATGTEITVIVAVAQAILIDPGDSDLIVYTGGTPSDGEGITCATAGATISLIRASDGNWYCTAIDGTWAEESP